MIGCAKIEDLQGYIPLLVGIHCKCPFTCTARKYYSSPNALTSAQSVVCGVGVIHCPPLSFFFVLAACLESAYTRPMSVGEYTVWSPI